MHEVYEIKEKKCYVCKQFCQPACTHCCDQSQMQPFLLLTNLHIFLSHGVYFQFTTRVLWLKANEVPRQNPHKDRKNMLKTYTLFKCDYFHVRNNIALCYSNTASHYKRWLLMSVVASDGQHWSDMT